MAAAYRNGNGNGSVATVTSSVAPWIAALIMAGGFFWQLVSPRDDLRAIEKRLDDKIYQLETRTREADSSLERIINLNAADVKNRVSNEAYAEFEKRKDMDTMRLDEMLRSLATVKANKEDEIKDILNLNDRINGLRGEVQDLRANVSGSVTIGKTLEHVQQEIDDLRKPVVAPVPMPLKPN